LVCKISVGIVGLVITCRKIEYKIINTWT